MASEEMPTILHDYWRSSSAYRVRIGLHVAGIPFQSRPVNLLQGEQLAPEYICLNPQGFVPTLQIDGLVLTQSLAILEYLHETKRGYFFPEDAAGKARVRALSYAIAMDLHPICNLSVAKHAIEASGGTISMQSWMSHFILGGLAAFEAMLDSDVTGKFCQGDELSIADICLLPQAYNARRWNVDISAFPRISRILSSLEQIPTITAAHPERYQSPEK
ncbi:maleylacetoacetate isomerase [Agrobacterium sp. SHOUNA12C]|jgi:maleylacetoacetate isomerase|nr:maleylacetoacetate isomerase [Agrobacterium sp. BETTINA12B]MCJ9757084.1 maleylacetoacetate isomerase [Agrobacterium sp. SHOUNA12C]